MKNINDEQIRETLGKDYTITLSGAILGYILQILADEQYCLNDEMAENITDPMAAMAAAANDVVGNTVLHAVYDAAGPVLLAIVMNSSPDAMDKLMKAQSPDDIDEAGRALGKDPSELRKNVERARKVRDFLKKKMN